MIYLSKVWDYYKEFQSYIQREEFELSDYFHLSEEGFIMGERKQDVYSLIKRIYLCLYQCFCLPFLLAVSVRLEFTFTESKS